MKPFVLRTRRESEDPEAFSVHFGSLSASQCQNTERPAETLVLAAARSCLNVDVLTQARCSQRRSLGDAATSLCSKNRTLAVFSLPQCQTRSSCPSQLRYSESEHCSLARRPRLASGTRPSRYAVSQPVHRDLFVHGIRGSTTAP